MANDIAMRLQRDLMRDYGLTAEQAAGFVGNLAHESGGFRTLQEVKPLIPGSRGGYGYAQWTGPRRRAFEAWTSQNSLDPASYEANYGFLRHELDNTPEGGFLGDLRAARDVGSATKVVEQKFLRPGIPHTESRMKWAQRVLGNDMPAMAAAQPAPSGARPSPAGAPQTPASTGEATSVASILGGGQRSPVGLLSMLGEQPQQSQEIQQQQMAALQQAEAARLAWARRNGWSV